MFLGKRNKDYAWYVLRSEKTQFNHITGEVENRSRFHKMAAPKVLFERISTGAFVSMNRYNVDGMLVVSHSADLPAASPNGFRSISLIDKGWEGWVLSGSLNDSEAREMKEGLEIVDEIDRA